jgi:hypothetical protein
MRNESNGHENYTDDRRRNERPYRERPETELIRVRATPEQVEILEKAARKDGLGLSSWLRMLGMKEARVQNIGRVEFIAKEDYDESSEPA